MRPDLEHCARRLSHGALAVALAAGGVAGLSTAAHAAPYCEPNTHYDIQDTKYIFIWDKKTWLRDGPGGVLQGSQTKASTISGTFGTKAEATINAIFSKVKAEVNASVTKSITTTVGHVFTHTITKGKYGNAKYGTWGFQARWREVRVFSNCASEVLSTGTAKLPTVAVGFRYFETKN